MNRLQQDIDSFVQDGNISSALPMDKLQSCNEPSISEFRSQILCFVSIILAVLFWTKAPLSN